METLIDPTCPTTKLAPSTKRRLRSAHRRRLSEQRHAVRRRAVAVAKRLAQAGRTLQFTAQQLHISSRTLRRWRQDHRITPRLWGRPLRQSSREQRNAVSRYIDVLGPGIGLAILQQVFSTMSRAELAELLRRYRRVWRKRHRRPLHVLHWTRPNTVWAMDFAEAPQAIEGYSKYLLAVRDLATGQQLLWQPVREATAQAAAELLAGLLVIHGPPLIVKSDNGSVFGAPLIETLLDNFGVLPLFSPLGTPSYNGAIEAGIGSMKARTEAHAARHGRPGAWTFDDVAAARLEANATARPHGPNGPTPDEAWATRTSVAPEDRLSFMRTVEQHRCQARVELEVSPQGPWPTMTARHVDRVAIRRACVEHGVLTFSRRLIPPPIPRQKADTIS